jgi:serine/threonine-protein kinase
MPLELRRETVVDRYVVEDLIGRGGMAVVYRVRHRQLGSVHAMKVITLPSPQLQERLIKEGQAQGGLRHPNVVVVTDVVEVRGCPALVMDLIEGPSLDVLLAREALTLPQADEIARGIISGVAAAHRAGLIHRDLKPANVMLAMWEGQLVPKVADFGLVKSVAGAGGSSAVKTRTGVTMGTPAYMSPEQIRDAGQVDERADVFSLGAILYELVTGRRAFAGQDTFELFAAITAGDFVPPRDLVPELPESMERAILGALRVDPEERTPSCAALLEAWTGQAPASGAHGAWDPAALQRVASLRSLEPRGPDEPVSDETWSADSFALEASGSEAASLAPGGVPTDAKAPTVKPTSEVRARPWWRYPAAAVVGLIAAVPFLCGVLVVIFGSIAFPISVGGPLMGLVLLCGLLSLGLPAVLGLREADGAPVVLGWFIGPGLAALCGSIGTWAGLQAVDSAVTRASFKTASALAAMGSSIALTTDVAGLSVAAVGCVTGAVTLAYTWSEQAGPIGMRGRATLALALIGGALLWVAHRVLGGQDVHASGGFFVFLVLVGGGASCAYLASSPSEALRRPRWLIGGLTVAGVAAAARAVDLQAQLHLSEKFRDTVHVVDQVLAAESFTAMASGGAAVSAYAWPLLAAGVAVISLFGERRVPVRARALILPVALLAVVMASRVQSNRSLERAISRIVPAALSLATRTELGFELTDLDPSSSPAWAPVGMEVVWVPEGSSLATGDVVIAVSGRPIHSVRDLIGAVRACECDQGGACTLGGACLASGTPLSFTVTRLDEGRPTNLERSVALPLGDLQPVVAPAQELEPFEELAALVKERPEPLVIAVSGLAGVGIEDAMARAMTLRLRGRLRDLPNTRVVDTEGHDWRALLEAHEDSGVALILLGSLAGVGGDRLLSLERGCRTWGGHLPLLPGGDESRSPRRGGGWHVAGDPGWNGLFGRVGPDEEHRRQVRGQADLVL